MSPGDSNVWHQVHAQREDGVAAMFLIRDVVPRADQPRIFVIELPYPVTDLSGQPDAAAYRRLGTFQEQWVEPACAALGWTFVAWKSEDGSFFLYLYGAGAPERLLEKLAPFDSELGFFNDVDADWSEYAALRELVEQSRDDGHDGSFDGEDDDGDGDAGRIDVEADGDDHVHTADCGHDHAGNGHHGRHHGSAHTAAATAQGIRVIDLTAEPPVTTVSLMDTPRRAERSGASAMSPQVRYDAEDDPDGSRPEAPPVRARSSRRAPAVPASPPATRRATAPARRTAKSRSPSRARPAARTAAPARTAGAARGKPSAASATRAKPSAVPRKKAGPRTAPRTAAPAGTRRPGPTTKRRKR